MTFSVSLLNQLHRGTVVVVGMPTDDNSTFMQGAALAPSRIHEVMHEGSSNWCSESGIDLDEDTRFRDLGDLEFRGAKEPLAEIEHAVTALLERGVYVIALGGDHAITYPIMKPHRAKYQALSILHLDAHPDLYDTYEGNPFSHACPFARIAEEGLADRVLQVGVRNLTPHQREQAERFGIEIIEMKAFSPGMSLGLEGPLYLSVDMDVLDPAFAPGVSHHEPGGLSTREVLGIIQDIRCPVVGADIVEFNPKRDPLGITAMASFKLLKEIAARMIELNH
jgi:agmatinase